MNPLPTCILFTRDAELTRGLEAYVGDSVRLRVVQEPGALSGELPPSEPVVVLLDLRCPSWRDVVKLVNGTHASRAVIIAMGIPRTEPALEAEELGVYAVADVAADHRLLRALVGQALQHVDLLRENNALRTRLANARSGAPAERERTTAAAPDRFQCFSHAFRHFDNVEAMLDSMVADIGVIMRVSRVGIFVFNSATCAYSLSAGVRCFEGTQEIEVALSDPLVHWMGANARFVSRATLDSVERESDRMMLAAWLDLLRAEMLIPLLGRNRLLGWLFAGQRVAGTPFTAPDLADLMPLAEHVSVALENALLYKEVAFQKTLAETTLHSIPVGIVAVDSDGIVRWLNNAAGSILDIDISRAVGQPPGKLSSRLADLLTRTLRDDGPGDLREWTDPATKRFVAVDTRRLMSKDECLGAVVMIRDMTDEICLRKKRSKLEREAFWTELAAAMSHEIRNPLVAISTFAQLLPERYGDEEFRGQFSELVSREISRLNSMIDQIDAFANPPELKYVSVPVERMLNKATDMALAGIENGKCQVECVGASTMPAILGDESALVDCFSHLILNSLEAVSHSAEPRVETACTRSKMGDGREAVLIRVKDNGWGIPLQLSEKVFSPFCTTKARGIGLGLPIVKRTVTDHGGQVTIGTSEKGTCVAVLLPAASDEKKGDHETPTRS